MNPARKRCVEILLALACAPAAAFTQKGNTITLTDEEAKECAAEGGCALTTVAFREEMIRALEKLKRDIENKICRRNAI